MRLARPESLRAAPILLAVLAASSFSGALGAQTEGRPARSLAPGFEDAAAVAAARVEEARVSHSIPGMSAAAWLDDQLVWCEGFGLADLQHATPVHPQTRFRLGSVSKLFAASLAARLAEQGAVDLDAPVEEYVEQCPSLEPPITLRLLLGHLAGIRHYAREDYAADRPGGNIDQQEYPDTASALAIFLDDERVAEPGERFSYTTFGFTLITAVLEEATGRSFEELLTEQVLAPLDLSTVALDRPRSIVPHRTSFYELEDGAVTHAPFMNPAYKWAGGGMIATPADVARFGAAHFAPGFLGEGVFADAFTSQTDGSGKPTGTGLGWRISKDDCGRTTYVHSGSQAGCRAMLTVWPEQELAVALLSNLTGTPRNLGDLAEEVGEDFHLLAPGASGLAAKDWLRQQLLDRKELDQAVRTEAMDSGLASGSALPDDLAQRWEAVDRENTAFLERVIDRHGWPGFDLVGEDGATAAFLFAQHADRRPEFQERCLPLLAAAVEAGQARPTDLAYLTDRVRRAQGKPQVYGTQVTFVDGEPVPQELEDPDHVDERRAAVGLGPLAEYLASMKALASDGARH